MAAPAAGRALCSSGVSREPRGAKVRAGSRHRPRLQPCLPSNSRPEQAWAPGQPDLSHSSSSGSDLLSLSVQRPVSVQRRPHPCDTFGQDEQTQQPLRSVCSPVAEAAKLRGWGRALSAPPACASPSRQEPHRHSQRGQLKAGQGCGSGNRPHRYLRCAGRCLQLPSC